MKIVRIFVAFMLLIAGFSNSDAQTPAKVVPVEVYYFHATHRCETCMAVEEVTKEALKQYFGDQVVFKSINSEKDKNNPLIKKYKVSGQTLLVSKGDKSEDLTNFAFMNARTRPDNLKVKIKETIDKMD